MDSVQPVPAPVPGRVALLERGACDAIFCHDQECAQYAISPHRYSVNNAPFLKVRAQFASEFGADAPLFCDRCHSPGGLLLGQPTGDWATESGIGCVPCHSFAEPGAHNGLGTYRYIDSYSRPTRALAEARPYYDWLIWWTKIHHKLDFVAKGREKACFPCHRVVMPERYVGREGLTLGDMVSPWEHSEVRRQGVDCNTCHTYLRKDTPDQPHASPDHVMLGTNQALEQTRLREVQGSERLGELRRLFDTVWLPGKVITVDWYHSADPIMQTVQTSFSEQEALAFGHSPLGVDIDARRRPDGAIDVRIETTNQVRAHPVPSGPLDFNEIWLELLVQDATGHVFLHSGQLDERFQVEPSARRLGATVVDRGGEPIQGHRFWTAAGLRDQRILGVDAKTEDRFVVPGPAGSDGRLTVRARWLYRRYNQEVAEWALGPGRTVPVSVFGSAEATVVGASP